ncbi:DNA-binding protein [Streptomyces sp. NPDC017949]|uniref:DNA-binding protein n=1 Tax=Streptomyces sp. NPDC017949 TaxID=3365020 RepID=UPI003789AD2C
MNAKRGTLPHLYHPADIAKALGMSEWWVKEQARRRRIPFTKPGRAYRFTDEQFAEILHLFETRPAASARVLPPRADPPVARASVGPRPVRLATAHVKLRARPPRRTSMSLNQQQDAA